MTDGNPKGTPPAGVHMADGPAGQRARLTGTGLDVWEVMSVVRDNDGDVQSAAEYLAKPLELVQAAVAYAERHPDEVEATIADNERVAAEAHAPG